MARHPLLTAFFVSLALCVASWGGWVWTATLYESSPQMPTPGIYLIGAYPWLGWMGTAFAVTTAVLAVILLRQRSRRKRVSSTERGFPVVPVAKP